MFSKVLAFFALLAVAFASPKPQVLTYATPGVAPLAYQAGYSGYTAPVAYASPYTAAAYASPYTAAAYPYAYSGAYYV